MNDTVRAVFRGGAFFPEEPRSLPEGTRVELVVQRRGVVPPSITDPDERRRILRELTADMRQDPLPSDSPRFSRDELHERR